MSFISLCIVGFAAGLLAAMGLGGGFVIVVCFALFSQTGQLGAQGLNLLFFIPITLLSSILHIKHKMIDVKTALTASLFGAVTAIGGFAVSRAIGGDTLRGAFAVFVIISGLWNLFSKKR